MRRIMNLSDALSFVSDERDRRALRRFNLMTDDQPPSVGALLDSLGFEVVFEDLPDPESGYLEQGGFSRKGWRIVINGKHSRVRQRFTALHEMAHYYLHRQGDDDPFAPVSYRTDFYLEEDRVQEKEANRFAEVIVFGDNALEGAIGLYGRDIRALAKHFGVSPQVIEIAIKNRT